MTVPGIVESALGDEEIAARVSLGGEDELFVTSSRTIVYRADGLLSDESADEFPHTADRLTLSEGRRKTKFTLEYSLEGNREFTIPGKYTTDVLHPVLAGILNGNGITDPGETVVQTYRFSELTVIVTSNRLVKHIGEPVWDDDFEQYHYDDVTNLGFESGSVATQIVLTVSGRPERIKAPNEEANDLRERLKRALLEYHDVETLAAFNKRADTDQPEADSEESSVPFDDGLEPLEANPPETDTDEQPEESPTETTQEQMVHSVDAGTEAVPQRTDETPASESQSSTDEPSNTDTTGTESTADTTAFDREFESATNSTNPALLERIESLEDAIEEQRAQIERQQQTIEQLITELRRGR